MKNTPLEQIIFFDGVCGLCNGFVDFVLSKDSLSQYRFSPLQGLTASEKFKDKNELLALKSIVLLDNTNEVHQGSTAVLKILASLGGVWSFSKILFLVPKKIRDFIYDWVARNRYLWFGKRETCRIPNSSERERFLA